MPQRKESIIGTRFSKLVILSEVSPRISKKGKPSRQVLCHCDCGVRKILLLASLRTGNSKSCGCQKPKLTIIGQTYGKLTVLSHAMRRKRNYSVCKCLCGNITCVDNTSLREGTHGCQRCKKKTHGYSGKPIYSVWTQMLQRCNNPSSPGFKDYGARGITVCERWLQFENFLADMGECPAGLTLDRVNNDKGYEKSNCEWRSMHAQSRNTRRNIILTVRGVSGCLMDLCKHFNLNYQIVRRRISLGVPPEPALFLTKHTKLTPWRHVAPTVTQSP